MQTAIVIERVDLIGRNSQIGARLEIGIVGVRNQGIEAVITPGQLHHHQDGIILPRHRGKTRSSHALERGEGAVDKGGDGRSKSTPEDDGAKKLAPGEKGIGHEISRGCIRGPREERPRLHARFRRRRENYFFARDP